MKQLAFSAGPTTVKRIREIATISNVSLSAVINSILTRYLSNPPTTAGTPRLVARVVAELPHAKQKLVYESLVMDAKHYRSMPEEPVDKPKKRGRGRPLGSKNRPKLGRPRTRATALPRPKRQPKSRPGRPKRVSGRVIKSIAKQT